ncbi:cupin domain-containing protein [Halococcus hamelinensis]|uniref:Cupin n=1 Tax=Halococcus hamelinensis 100A6 TaxID=1132509 RepID=M0LRL2_9EURY|nr:cupin domain-containing protein [Halococcus hamelinensis]EMA35738.1 cupin [Halococcus hamelinensis 100A6]
MEQTSIRNVESSPTETGVDRRRIGNVLGTTDVAINHYALEPGERFAESVHAHMDQEEVFVVLDGTATFEVRGSGDGTSRKTTVGTGEAVRFEPGEFQRGENDSSERVRALAFGAPRGTDDVRIARIPGVGEIACPDCGRGEMRIPDTGTALVCPDCGGELVVE